MYCAKCGTKNPDSGKYCRKCGATLPKVIGNGDDFVLENWVNDKLAPHFTGGQRNAKKKKKDVELSWEAAMGSIGSGIAFIIISIVLAYQPMGFGWWFWMLIPGFGALGVGIAQVIRLQKEDKRQIAFSEGPPEKQIDTEDRAALPPDQSVFAEDEFRMPEGSGEFAPPSVTEGTTRHLEMDSEVDTSKLEKDD
ncbi:MAG: hypothetical protein DWQ47_12460 [Acidobacteria bacterium]|nr:MAG: hypothetical protein DWQ32_14875 [Acidobacteriota bacterium]REJ98381.1 MAG: hypothetical protein DWQ38_17675 [Acidobacteriota bacterium]REK17125.1 MAG: hypothetical protein DWQ43_02720 [Acidobacteriota bacterium]REK43035.1 MAG: hypothetical protein DWQ47_12460 [Acidobacteriota bacterium]